LFPYTNTKNKLIKLKLKQHRKNKLITNWQ